MYNHIFHIIQRDFLDNKEASEENAEVNAADVVAGSAMSSAGELPFNLKATGLVESGKTAWYSFTTDSTEKETRACHP